MENVFDCVQSCFCLLQIVQHRYRKIFDRLVLPGVRERCVCESGNHGRWSTLRGLRGAARVRSCGASAAGCGLRHLRQWKAARPRLIAKMSTMCGVLLRCRLSFQASSPTSGKRKVFVSVTTFGCLLTTLGKSITFRKTSAPNGAAEPWCWVNLPSAAALHGVKGTARSLKCSRTLASFSAIRMPEWRRASRGP